MSKAYISSTYIDLVEYREAVYKALRKNRYDVIAMEDYVASDERPLDKCLQDVRESSVYIGIFGRRYGYIPPNHTQSITELEYREASKARVPVLVFLLDSSVSWEPEHEDDDQTAIQGLRSELQTDKLVKFFKTPEDLVIQVLTSLRSLQLDGAKGLIHINESRIEVPQWSEFAEVHFSITNQSDQVVKIHSLALKVVQREPYDEVRVRREGAPVLEFKLKADITDRDQVDLLAGLNVQFITNTGESEAMNLVVACRDGFLYHCELHCSLAEVRNSEVHELEPATFSIVYPIASLETLKTRKSGGN